jgi:hypothetical protein
MVGSLEASGDEPPFFVVLELRSNAKILVLAREKTGWKPISVPTKRMTRQYESKPRETTSVIFDLARATVRCLSKP